MVVVASVARPLLLHKVGSEVGRDVWSAVAGGRSGLRRKGKTKPDGGLARMPPSLVSDERVWHVKE